MKHGFIKAAAITPDLKVADPVYNSQVICQKIEEAEKEGAVLLVFPELCISGYTCHDLFLQETLLVACKEQLQKIAGFKHGSPLMESSMKQDIFKGGMKRLFL